MTYITKAFIFFNRGINYIFIFFILLLVLSTELIDIFELTQLPENPVTFITENQIGSSTLFSSLFFLMNLDRCYKKKLLHNFLLLGETNTSIFRLITSFIFIAALVNLLLFVLSLSIYRIYHPLQSDYIEISAGISKFLCSSVFYNLILTIFYFFIRNVFVVILSFFTLYFIDRRLSIYFDKKSTFLPLDTLYRYVNDSSKFIYILPFLIAFFAIVHLQTTRKKDWL